MVDCAGILLMSTSAPVAMDAPAAMVIEGGGRLFNTNGYTTTTIATTLRTLEVYFVFIHLREIAGAFAEIPQCSLICRCYLYFTYRSYLFSVLVLSMNCRALFQLLDSFNEGPQKGCSIPRS